MSYSTRPRKRLKSQFPRGKTANHVEYILAASFDIDKGPMVENQYPGAIAPDEHMLAELMLPDGVHARNQDWTIFFLHKDNGAEEESPGTIPSTPRTPKLGSRESVNGRDSDFSSDEEPESDTAQLIYVLNLVNTKLDKSSKRGADVRAMAICTRHPFLHIYKPLLLLALDRYFQNPSIDVLASLFEAVNSMDLSLMPRLSSFERTILNTTENKDLFRERFEQMIRQQEEDGNLQSSLSSSVTVLSPNGEIPANSTLLPRDTHEFETKVHYDGVPVPVKVPTALSSETVGDISLIKLITTISTPHSNQPIPFSPLHPHLTTSGPMTHPMIVLVNALLTEKRIVFLGAKLPSGTVAEAVLAACALASGSVLKGFTRHAFPYTDLSKIDDLLNVPGFIAGVTNPAFALKSEWWDVLVDIGTGRIRISDTIERSNRDTEGMRYFRQLHPGIDFSAAGGSIGLNGASSHGGTSQNSDPTGDQGFMDSVLRSVAARHGENVIRNKWRDWITKFTRIAAAFEEAVFGASALSVGVDQHFSPISPADHPRLNGSNISPTSALRVNGYALRAHGAGTLPDITQGHGYIWASAQDRDRELASSIHRIEGWRSTRSYYSFIQDLAESFETRPVKHLDLQHLHDRLRIAGTISTPASMPHPSPSLSAATNGINVAMHANNGIRLTPTEAQAIYNTLADAIHSNEEISQLLTVTPENHAGLFYVSLGLFHPKPLVREKIAKLLMRIEKHEVGRHFVQGLGGFIRLGLQREKLRIGGS